MDRGLFFLILSMLFIWLTLDDFFGKKYVTKLANRLTPTFSILDEKKEQYQEAKDNDPLIRWYEEKVNESMKMG